MANTTLYSIYKEYKHSEDIEQYGLDKVYRALKANFLQVVIVTNQDDIRMLYNYVPELNDFFYIMQEQLSPSKGEGKWNGLREV